MLLWIGLCSAATVAVVDFQAWGVSHDDADLATEGVRAALLSAGVLDSLPGSDISDGVSASTESDLRSARAHAAEARRLYLSGDYAGAVSAASEAVQEHATALSDVGRRPEFADAWYTLGVANVKLQRNIDASDAFLHVGALYPHYLEERATNVPPAATALLSAAQREAARPQIDAEEIARVRSLLRVDWVVTGAVTEEGEIVAQVWGPGTSGEVRVRAELKGYFLPVPVPEISDVYGRIAADIGRKAVLVQSVAVQADVDQPAGEDEPAAPRRRPITSQWWFWAGAGAIAGGGVLVGYSLWQPDPVQVPGEDTWSVEVTGF